MGSKFQLTHFNSWLKGKGYETLLSYLYDLYLVLYMECTLNSTYLGFLALPFYVCSCRINKSEMFRAAMPSCLLLFALIRVPQQPEEWRCLRSVCVPRLGPLIPFHHLASSCSLGKLYPGPKFDLGLVHTGSVHTTLSLRFQGISTLTAL